MLLCRLSCAQRSQFVCVLATPRLPPRYRHVSGQARVRLRGSRLVRPVRRHFPVRPVHSSVAFFGVVCGVCFFWLDLSIEFREAGSIKFSEAGLSSLVKQGCSQRRRRRRRRRRTKKRATHASSQCFQRRLVSGLMAKLWVLPAARMAVRRYAEVTEGCPAMSYSTVAEPCMDAHATYAKTNGAIKPGWDNIHSSLILSARTPHGGASYARTRKRNRTGRRSCGFGLLSCNRYTAMLEQYKAREDEVVGSC